MEKGKVATKSNQLNKIIKNQPSNKKSEKKIFQHFYLVDTRMVENIQVEISCGLHSFLFSQTSFFSKQIWQILSNCFALKLPWNLQWCTKTRITVFWIYFKIISINYINYFNTYNFSWHKETEVCKLYSSLAVNTEEIVAVKFQVLLQTCTRRYESWYSLNIVLGVRKWNNHKSCSFWASFQSKEDELSLEHASTDLC